MKSTGGGAVFGKPTARRSSVGGGDNSTATLVKQSSDNDMVKEKEKEKEKDSHHVKTTKAEAKMKLIQMEIAEKEACSIIRTLCADASALLPPSEQSIEITDLLTGVLLLGNLARRIGYENEQLSKKVSLLNHEKEVAVSEKTSLIEQLEQVIMRLQGDNQRLSDQIAENNLKSNQKATIMARDLFNHRETIDSLKADIIKLQSKIQYQERRMMDVPRMEENFMRQARGMIRQQEMANTMTKIEWKKIEEEAKLCQFWKGKAKAMEETIEQQKTEIEHLTNTARSNFAKYQQATQTLNSLKNSGKGFSGVLSKQQTASSLARQQQQQQQQQARPTSAPSLRRVSSAARTLPQGVSSDTGDGTEDNDVSRPLRKVASMASASGDDKLRAELLRLRDALEEKNAQVLRLSQQLSRARAYPLISARIPRREGDVGGHARGGWVRDDDREDHDAHFSSSSAEGAHVEHSLDAPTKKRGALDVLDEDLELTAEEEAEELRLEEERVERALTYQRDYNERVQRRRANNPPHIAAIRNSRSFLKDA